MKCHVTFTSKLQRLPNSALKLCSVSHHPPYWNILLKASIIFTMAVVIDYDSSDSPVKPEYEKEKGFSGGANDVYNPDVLYLGEMKKKPSTPASPLPTIGPRPWKTSPAPTLLRPMGHSPRRPQMNLLSTDLSSHHLSLQCHSSAPR